MLPPVSAWAKSHILAGITRHGGRPDASTPAGLVAFALDVYPGRARTLSAAQVFRIVARVSCSLPMEMQADAALESIPDVFLTVRSNHE